MASERKGRGKAARQGAGQLGEQDFHLLNEGTHVRLYDKLGAHLDRVGGEDGAWFSVWAPDAAQVSVIGDFNGWRPGKHVLGPTASGVFRGFVAGIGQGTVYKYHISSRHAGYRVEKADPFAFHAERPPRTASIVWDLDRYEWSDQEWMRGRARRQALSAPMSFYEVHLGSWRRVPEQGNRALGYRELGVELADYVRGLGFTHVEILPVMEHPFYGSWGYQVTGYFAPTSRMGTPDDFMAMIDVLHQAGIGVILDWVPSHFPTDEHGLGYFDGTHLYEHQDPRQGFHPDWKSSIFNYGRNEVRAFLISSALFWLDRYHVDGLRVDGVASMLYRDYSRQTGGWVPNVHGGRENLEAIHFLRAFNEAVYRHHPDAQTIAEESTSWPMVSRPNYVGGLGFGLKWDMGWMHDTLAYMGRDPIYRSFHHNALTFRMMYAHHENFVLPLSHDEVVHGKRSLLDRMPGDGWQKFANLRLLLAYMWAQPGKKLLFMGGEFGQGREWDHDRSLDWDLLAHPLHQGVLKLVGDLNRVYRGEPALHELDCDPAGFEWIDLHDAGASVVSFLRRGRRPEDLVIAAFNFTPVVRRGYRLGAPAGGFWKEALNTDAGRYGGGNVGNEGGREARPLPAHGRPFSLELVLPPLAAVLLCRDATGVKPR